MAALDLLGRRWALGVVWQLRSGPRSYGALQRELEGVSSSVLATRLRELGEALLVDTNGNGEYCLTKSGRALAKALDPVERWSHRWGQEFDDRT